MSKKNISGFFIVLLVGVLFGVAVYWHSDKVAMLNPKGAIAAQELDLMLYALGMMLLVVIPVFILTFFITWKYREENTDAEYTPHWNDNVLAETIWWGFPTAIIIVLSVITWESSHALDPFKPIETGTPPLKIQVVALQWKWLFIYPDQKIATVNFVQIPEKTPIDFEISADAPMNSFWIPQLGGQIYAMPGMKTKLHLIAEEPGSFAGYSANLSGEGFAGMTFNVKSTSQADFNQWVESIQHSAAPLGQGNYTALAKPSKYLPAATYTLSDEGLFDWIVMKPMMQADPKHGLGKQNTLEGQK